MRRSLIMVFAVLALAGTACSSGGGNSSAGATSSTGATIGPTTTPGGTTGATTGGGCSATSATQLGSGTLTIQDFAFQPDCFSVTTGSQIKVTNKDSTPHTFTVTDTNVDVELDGGHSGTADLSSLQPGTYAFHCTIHPTMTGTFVVS